MRRVAVLHPALTSPRAAARRPGAGAGGGHAVWAGVSGAAAGRGRYVAAAAGPGAAGGREHLRANQRRARLLAAGAASAAALPRGHRVGVRLARAAALRARRLRGRPGPHHWPGSQPALAGGPAAALRPEPGQQYPHRPVAGPRGLPAPPAPRPGHRLPQPAAPYGPGRPGHRPSQWPPGCRLSLRLRRGRYLLPERGYGRAAGSAGAGHPGGFRAAYHAAAGGRGHRRAGLPRKRGPDGAGAAGLPYQPRRRLPAGLGAAHSERYRAGAGGGQLPPQCLHHLALGQ